ncbi:MAG: hypothetical protein WCK05_17070, partial [Planctomycetota bacterium]
MLSTGEQTALFLRLVTILIPLGVYFLLLGVLNSRRHPQLLSGRRDFTLLLAAFSPMLLLPVLSALAVPAWGGAAAAGVLAIGYADAYGGVGGDLSHVVVASEAIVLAGRSVGTTVGLGSHGIALP